MRKSTKIELLKKALHNESVYSNKLEEKIQLLDNRIESLENPAKYEVGQNLNHKSRVYCGDEQRTKQVTVIDNYYDNYEGRVYSLFDGKKVFSANEIELSEIEPIKKTLEELQKDVDSIYPPKYWTSAYLKKTKEENRLERAIKEVEKDFKNNIEELKKQIKEHNGCNK